MIESDRLSGRDIEVWVNCEEGDFVHAERISGVVERSQVAIRNFGACNAYCGVSWGKDSVAVAHLLSEISPDVVLVNLRCSNRNPDCDSVRDSYLKQHPMQRYEEIPVEYGDLHGQLGREELNRETDRRWKAGFEEAARRFGARYFSGIRKGESTSRFLRVCRWGESTKTTCAPLAHWTHRDVFAYLAINNLPVHPAYAMQGGGRYPREKLRVAEIGDTHGTGGGRREWEQEYYGPELRRIEVGIRLG